MLTTTTKRASNWGAHVLTHTHTPLSFALFVALQATIDNTSQAAEHNTFLPH